MDIDGKRGMKSALRILGCCIILHNILLDCKEDDIQDEWLKEIVDAHQWTNEDGTQVEFELDLD